MDYNNINLTKLSSTNSFFDDDFFSNITPIGSDATAKVATDVLKQQSTLKASDKPVLSEKKRKIRDFDEDEYSLRELQVPNYSLGDSLYSNEKEVPSYSLQPLTPATVLDSKIITPATVINRKTTSSSSNNNLSSSSSSSSSSSEDYLETAQKIKKALIDNPYEQIPIFPELPPEDLLECYKEWKSKSIQPVDDVLLIGNRKPRNYPLLMLDVLVKHPKERMHLAKKYTFSKGTSFEYFGKLKLQDPKSSIVSAAARLLKESETNEPDPTERMHLPKEYTFSKSTSYEDLGKLNLQDPKSSIVSAAAQSIKKSERSDPDQTISIPQVALEKSQASAEIEKIKKDLIDNPYKEIPKRTKLTPGDLLECYTEWKLKSIPPVDNSEIKHRKPHEYPLLILDVLVKQDPTERKLLAWEYKFNGFSASDFFKRKSKPYYVQAASFFLEELKKST